MDQVKTEWQKCKAKFPDALLIIRLHPDKQQYRCLYEDAAVLKLRAEDGRLDREEFEWRDDPYPNITFGAHYLDKVLPHLIMSCYRCAIIDMEHVTGAKEQPKPKPKPRQYVEQLIPFEW